MLALFCQWLTRGFFNGGDSVAEFGEPPVEHGAVGDSGLEAVVHVAFFEDALVAGERGFGQVKSGGFRDGEGESDAFAFAEAEAAIREVLFQVEVGGAGEGHGAAFAAAHAVQGEVAFVVVVFVAGDEVEGGALLREGKRHDAVDFALAVLVLVVDVEPAVFKERLADLAEDGAVDGGGDEGLAGGDGADFAEPFMAALVFVAVGEMVVGLGEEGGKRCHDVGGQEVAQVFGGEFEEEGFFGAEGGDGEAFAAVLPFVAVGFAAGVDVDVVAKAVGELFEIALDAAFVAFDADAGKLLVDVLRGGFLAFGDAAQDFEVDEGGVEGFRAYGHGAVPAKGGIIAGLVVAGRRGLVIVAIVVFYHL